MVVILRTWMIVNFLFLIHNTNERVKDQLIEKMKATDALVDILQLAKIVKSTVQTENLSKQLFQNVGKLGNTTTEVHSVTKHSQSHNRQNHSKSNHGRSQNHDKNKKYVVIVVINILINNAQHMRRNV